MTDVCEFHKEMVSKQDAQGTAIEGKIAKSTIKWIATIFSVPTLGAILTAWAFIASADYRYGSNLQAQNNATNIKLLDERTVNLKQEIIKMQGDISSDLSQIKLDLKDIAKDLKFYQRHEEAKAK
jgi:hypothetical protein